MKDLLGTMHPEKKEKILAKFFCEQLICNASSLKKNHHHKICSGTHPSLKHLLIDSVS